MEFLIPILLLVGIGLLVIAAAASPTPRALPPPQRPPSQIPRLPRITLRRGPAVFRKCEASNASPPGPCHICGQLKLAGEDHSHM